MLRLFHRWGSSSQATLFGPRSFGAQFSDDAKQKSKKAKETKKKSKSPTGQGDYDQQSKELKIMLAALDAKPTKEPPISDEEKARRYQIGRNFVIGRFQQNNLIDHDLSCKIRLKEHAIKMLPKDSKLREEALKISDELPPIHRNIPVWTPPIPDFDPKQYVLQDDEEK